MMKKRIEKKKVMCDTRLEENYKEKTKNNKAKLVRDFSSRVLDAFVKKKLRKGKMTKKRKKERNGFFFCT